MEIIVYQVTKQEDESYIASLRFTEAGKTLAEKSVRAFNIPEFKTKIREFKEKIEALEAEQQSLISLVQTAIDEVMAEV